MCFEEIDKWRKMDPDAFLFLSVLYMFFAKVSLSKTNICMFCFVCLFKCILTAELQLRAKKVNTVWLCCLVKKYSIYKLYIQYI